MNQIAAQGYIYENGVQVVDPNWVEKKGDIVAYQLVYNFPEDMAELLFLNIDVPGIEFYIEGTTFVLKAKPTQWIHDAITIHYRRKHD